MSSSGTIRAGRAFVELFADDSKLVRGLRRAETKLKAFGDGVRNLGLKMAGLGTAIAAPLIGAGKVFGDFETQMKMVSTMLDEPAKHMDAYAQGIRRLSVQFGEGTDVLAKGLYDLLSASVDPAAALDVLAVATKAAKGGMTDTAVAVDGLTSVLNAFGMSADRAGHVADVMFQTVKRGKLTFPDLAANIGKVAPMARAAGMSMEDMMAAIATMTRQGLSAEESTTRLVNILKHAPEQAGNLAGLVARFVGKNLSQIQLDFPEVRAAGGIAALAADMEGFRKDLLLMQTAAGRADEAFERMTGGLSGSFKKARMAVTDLMVSVGEALAPTLKAAAEWFKKAAIAAGEWIKQNQQIIVSVLKVAAVTVGVGVSLVVLGTIISGLGSMLGALIAVITSVGVAMKALSAVIAFLVSPIGAAIAAVAALGAGILYATGAGGAALAWLGERFADLASDASAAYQGIAEALAAGDIALAARILWLTLRMEWEKGTHFLLGVWLDLKGKLLAVLDDFVYGGQVLWAQFVYGIQVAWAGLVSGLQAAWAKFSAWHASTVESTANWIAKRWVELQGMFDDTLDVQFAKKFIDDQSAERFSEIAQQEKSDISAAQSKRDDALKSAGDQRDKRLLEIGTADAAKQRQRQREYEQRLRDSQAELDAARKEWQEALAEAKARRESAGTGAVGGPPGLEDLRKMMDGLGETLATAAQISQTGTFSAQALWGLGTGSTAERTAKAAEDTAKGVKKLNEKAERGELVFAP